VPTHLLNLVSQENMFKININIINFFTAVVVSDVADPTDLNYFLLLLHICQLMNCLCI
jgi:hypothetical protein